VLHVVPDVTLAGASRYMYRFRQREYQRQLAREAWRRIAELVPANTNAPRVHTRVAIGKPAVEISRVAREADADLILVGAAPTGNDDEFGIAA
jgi:nucleotide-binding universal stress UspA family protein